MTIGYACVANAGDDANIFGVPYSTRAAAELFPLETYGTINTNAKWASGLNVLGNGGDTFEELVTVTATGAANDEIALDRYGSGADPILTPLTLNPAWSTIDVSGEYYLSGITGTELCLIENGVRLTGLMRNWGVSGPAAGTLNAGEWAYDSATSRLYYKPTTGVPTDHIIYATTSAVATAAVLSNGNSYINISNVECIGATDNYAIVDIRNGTNINVDNVTAHGGWRGIQFFDVDTYTQTNCHVYDICWAAMGGRDTDPLNGEPNGSINNNLIEDIGTLSTDYGDCEGIVIGPGSDNTNAKYNTIRRWGRAAANPGGTASMYMTAIISDKANNAVIEGNEIYDGYRTAISMKTFDAVNVIGNIAKSNLVYGINPSTSDSSSSRVIRVEAVGTSSIVAEVINNTIWGNDATVATPIALQNNGVIAARSAQTGAITLTIKNNVVSENTGEEVLSTLVTHDGGSITLTSDNNCFYRTTGTDGIYERTYIGTPSETAWTYANILGGASGNWDNDRTQDLNSITTDPLFIDAANDDFRLSTASPCLGAGTYISSVSDFYDRPFSINQPDMGAIDFHSGRKFKQQSLLKKRFYRRKLSYRRVA